VASQLEPDPHHQLPQRLERALQRWQVLRGPRVGRVVLRVARRELRVHGGAPVAAVVGVLRAVCVRVCYACVPWFEGWGGWCKQPVHPSTTSQGVHPPPPPHTHTHSYMPPNTHLHGVGVKAALVRVLQPAAQRLTPMRPAHVPLAASVLVRRLDLIRQQLRCVRVRRTAGSGRRLAVRSALHRVATGAGSAHVRAGTPLSQVHAGCL
jgi:hypothetical protein